MWTLTTSACCLPTGKTSKLEVDPPEKKQGSWKQKKTKQIRKKKEENERETEREKKKKRRRESACVCGRERVKVRVGEIEAETITILQLFAKNRFRARFCPEMALNLGLRFLAKTPI